jgi:hypothetical protein
MERRQQMVPRRYEYETRAAASPRRTFHLSASRKALQNTGLLDFRQSQFVDTRYTLGYTWWFLPSAFVIHGARMGRGGVAQLGERLNGIQEVRGSIPLASMAWQE